MAQIEMTKSATGPTTGLAPMPIAGLEQFNPVVGASILDVRQEIDDAYADMKTFVNREPDEIMRISGGHSARLSEIRVKIMRVEDFLPQWRSIRTREIEATLEELTKQYQIASRLHSVRQLDWDMESGQHS